MADIHPLAAVSPDAEIGEDVSVGPFCLIGADVRIDEGCRLASHVAIKNGVTLGRNNHLHEGAVVGGRPQHVGCPDQVGEIIIGDDNILREHVTVHCAMNAGGQTRIGNGNYLMIGVHVAHDCVLGDQIIIANQSGLSGH
ncbi:MAG: acyl-ACP--UDP-N-acetylglucosamine O-acyltransferase, partial [Planctomycetales bacterium]